VETTRLYGNLLKIKFRGMTDLLRIEERANFVEGILPKVPSKTLLYSRGDYLRYVIKRLKLCFFGGLLHESSLTTTDPKGSLIR